MVMATVVTMHFSKSFNSWVKIRKTENYPVVCKTKKIAKTKRKELLKFGLDNITHFVQHHDDIVHPKFVT